MAFISQQSQTSKSQKAQYDIDSYFNEERTSSG